jgi:hypothetical protein
VGLGIPYSAPWIWEFYQFTPYLESSNVFGIEPGLTDPLISKVEQANQALGNPGPPLTSPDTSAPQIVLTWPLESAELTMNQLVNAVASDNSGVVSRVEFRVDGILRSTALSAPYHFILDPTTLAAGDHTITAAAYDGAGNAAEYTTPVRNNPNLSRPVVAITDFSPMSGRAGTEVTINGANLSRATLVLIGNIPARILSAANTTLRAKVERGASGPVEVITSDGAASSTATFTLLAPAIDSVAYDGRKTLTISGSQFGAAPRVSINDQDKTDFIASSTDTSITIKGKAKRLGLKSGNNTLQVIDSAGTTSNVFTLIL